MDNEYTPPHYEGDHGYAPPPAPEPAPTPDASAIIEQVRELLFGDHRRNTEVSLKSVEDKLAALTATIEARFADLERRLSESKSASDHAHDTNVEAIGAALSDLGDKIKSLIAKPSY